MTPEQVVTVGRQALEMTLMLSAEPAATELVLYSLAFSGPPARCWKNSSVTPLN